MVRVHLDPPIPFGLSAHGGRTLRAARLRGWGGPEAKRQAGEGPARSGQAAHMEKPGALAQLGERLICIQEVIGSIPIGSTIALFPRFDRQAAPGCLAVQSDEELTS